MPTNSQFVVEFDGGAPLLTDSQIGALLREHTAFKEENETLKAQVEAWASDDVVMNKMGVLLFGETNKENAALTEENETLKKENLTLKKANEALDEREAVAEEAYGDLKVKLDKAEKEIMELEKEIDWRVREAKEDKAELSEKVFAAEEVLDNLGYKWSEEYGGYSCETEEEEEDDEEWLEEFSDEPLSQTKKALPYLEEIKKTQVPRLKTIPYCYSPQGAKKPNKSPYSKDWSWYDPRDECATRFYRVWGCFQGDWKNAHPDPEIVAARKGQLPVFKESMKFFAKTNTYGYGGSATGMRKGTKVKMDVLRAGWFEGKCGGTTTKTRTAFWDNWEGWDNPC